MEKLRLNDLNHIKKSSFESPHHKSNNQVSKNKKFYPTNISLGINRKFSVPFKSNKKQINIYSPKKSNLKSKKDHNPTNKNLNKLFYSPNRIKEVSSPLSKSPRDFINVKGVSYSNLVLSPVVNSRLKEANTSKSSAFFRMKSPTSNILNTKINYNTELDYNSIVDRKFYDEACQSGKRNLSTKAMKLNSPDRYDYSNSPQKTFGGSKNGNTYTSSFCKINLTSNNDKKPSESVLTEMIDLQYSHSSPQRKKIGIDTTKLEEKKSDKDKIYEEEDKTINLSFNGEAPQETFIEAFETFKCIMDTEFKTLDTSQKINKSFDILSDNRKSYRLGAIIYMYIILKRKEADENCSDMILVKIIELLKIYEKFDEIFLVSCLELLSLFGIDQRCIDLIPLISMFLTDFNFPRLQKSAFNCLMRMGIEGIRNLVEIALKETNDLQYFILGSLLKTPHIQKLIIIPALLNDLFSNNTDKIYVSLSALNRLSDLITETDAIKILPKFFQNTYIEKQLLASTIRSAGEQGEEVLIEQLRLTKDHKIKVAIASILSYRLPKNPKYLIMNLENYEKRSLLNSPPGNLYKYIGRVCPVALDNYQFEENSDYMEVNVRDFLAALQRMLMIQNNHKDPKIVHTGNYNLLDDFIQFIKKNDKLCSFANLEDFSCTDSQEETDKFDKIPISEEVISALAECLKDQNPLVRETAVSTLGKIGLPEALLCVDSIVNLINDADINVKTKAIWSLGKLAGCCDVAALQPVIDNLKSNVWKVKMACFVTLTSFGSRCAHLVLATLRKMLKESSVNKQVIAETIIKLGIDGESCLLEVMRSEIDSNYKLKACIAKSLALTNITSPNIDFIVECLYKHAASNSSIIRKACLFSLRILHEKSEEKITYLQTRNILPFYYKCLLDKDSEIQSLAINSIKNLGSQGELLFSEGLAKDSNPIVRCQCAVGLAELGVSTMVTLLNAINDENETVRKTVEKEIIGKFSVETIIQFYSESPNKLKLNRLVLSILEKKNLKPNSKLSLFLKELNVGLSKKDVINIEEKLLNSENEIDENQKSFNMTSKLQKNDFARENN